VYLLLFIWLLYPSWVSAADVSLHGFLQGNYSVDSASANPDGKDFKVAEERVQLKFDAVRNAFHAFIKADAFYDHLDTDAELKLREGYVDFIASNWDARIGRQIVTWGLGDRVFINDVFPKDHEAFFSGRPLEYLKKAVDGVKLGIYPGFASFEIITVPFFEPDRFPGSNRFWMYDPMSNITNRNEAKPATTLENTELALRAYGDLKGFDTSIYFYKGFFRQPSVIPDNRMLPTKLTLSYPKLTIYGASLQGRALDGVLSLEAAYYDSREDRNGNDPLIQNSQTRFLVGYQRQLWEDFTIGLQYYGEYMHDYSTYEDNLPPGFPRDRRLHDLASAQLTQLMLHQTLRLSFFSFYSLSDGDYMVNPEIKYNFSDHIWTAVGANIFGGGKAYSHFGQLSKNDNAYLQIRYEF
jgi:hypothetical protein